MSILGSGINCIVTSTALAYADTFEKAMPSTCIYVDPYLIKNNVIMSYAYCFHCTNHTKLPSTPSAYIGFSYIGHAYICT